MIRPKPFCFIDGERGARGVPGRRQVERDDRFILLGREILDRADVLDAGIVDEDVDAAEACDRLLDEAGGLFALHQVGAVVDDAAARMILLELGEDALDIFGLAEAVDDDVGARLRQMRGRCRGRCRWSIR